MKKIKILIIECGLKCLEKGLTTENDIRVHLQNEMCFVQMLFFEALKCLNNKYKECSKEHLWYPCP